MIAAHIKTSLQQQSWMKSSNDIKMPLPLEVVKSTKKSMTGSSQNLNQRHIAWLWIQLTSLYTNLFITKFGKEDSGVWVDTLGDLTPKALESGMSRLKTLQAGVKFAEFPPNPMQFRAICLSYYDELDLPSPSNAYQDIKLFGQRALNKLHPIVQFMVSKLPEDFFIIEQDYISYQIFKGVYEKVCSLIKQGHALPSYKQVLFQRKLQTKEVAKTHLTNMLSRLRGMQ